MRLTLLLWVLIYSSFLHAQISKSSSVVALRTDDHLYDKVTTKSNDTYVLRFKLGKVAIDHFNEFLMLSKTNTFELKKYNKLWPLAYRLIVMDGKLMLMCVTSSVLHGQELLALPVDPVSLEPVGDYISLCNEGRHVGNRDYQFAVSADGKYMVAASFALLDSTASEPSEHAGVYSFTVLNNEMKVVQRSALREYDNGTRRTVYGVTITNEGKTIATVKEENALAARFENYWRGTGWNQFSTGWIFPHTRFTSVEEANTVLREMKNSFAFYTFRQGESIPAVARLLSKDKTIADVLLTEQENGRFTVAGLYSVTTSSLTVDTVMATSKNKNAALAQHLLKMINGVFVQEGVLLNSDISIDSPLSFSSPVKFEEMSKDWNAGSVSEPSSLRRKVVIHQVIREGDGEWTVLFEVNGERIDPPLMGYDYVVTPFADNGYIAHVNLSTSSCSLTTIRKFQITLQEPLQYMSFVYIPLNAGPAVFYNHFTIAPLKNFTPALLLTNTTRTLKEMTSDGKFEAAAYPDLNNYSILSQTDERWAPASRIQIAANAKEYKLVLFE